MSLTALTASDLRVCRALHKKHGKSYYFATKLFPRDIRKATHVLYAFFRVPDEIVDNPALSTPEAIRKELEAWQAAWNAMYERGAVTGRKEWDAVLRSTATIFKMYDVPFEYSQDFLRAMLQDTEKATYANYRELESYMYGSAAVVGLMMAHVIGFTDRRALLFAEELGYAMQLTNFLRDIREDWEERRRVYLPADEMASFGVTVEDISGHRVTEAFQRFMAFQATRARALYVSADEGVALLNAKGQLPVRVAAALYEAILDKIEGAGWDVFQSRARTTFVEKLWLFFSVWQTSKKQSLSARESADWVLPPSLRKPDGK